MDPFVIGIIGACVLLVLLGLGVHLGVALGVVGFVGAALIVGLNTALFIATGSIFYFVTEYAFVLLPLFIEMGFMAASGGLASRIYNSFEVLFGRVRGGSGAATVASCAAFGTITGSSIAAAATFARVSGPELRRLGYEKNFTYGLIAASGTIAMLIPPSVIAIVYGVVSQESIGKLLIAGLGPGTLMSGVFIAGMFALAKINPSLVGTSRVQARGFREIGLALVGMWPVGVIATVIIGGIYTGFITVVEAGAVGALLVLLIGLFSKQLRFRDVKENLTGTIETCAMLFFIFTCASIFARFLALSGISIALASGVIDLGLSPIIFVIISAVVFILFGCLLDSVSMITILIPLFAPIVTTMGIDPIWYAMVVIVAIHVGLVTPPVGLNIYAVVGAATGAGEKDVNMMDVFRGVMPFFFLMLAVLAIIIAFPQLSTWVEFGTAG